MNTVASLRDVPITKIYLGRNPRTRFDEQELQALAQSIQKRGQQQPIVLEPYKDGFILVMGERRLRAHKLLGRTTIQAYVRGRTNHNGRERFLDAVIENDQRTDMTTMETAHAYQALRDEFKLTIRQISQRIGKAESTITNLLILTDLDPEIQALIDHGFWKDTRLARGLLKIEDKGTRVELARQLWNHRASLKGCLAAVENTLKATKTTSAKQKLSSRSGTPSLILAEAEAKPARWDMMKQLGRVPAWELVVLSAEQTCNKCPLRSMASRVTCSDCGAVDMLRAMMEAVHGNA
jgi:ParB family transcriptional regulator, chromosome partitioning protein